LYNGVIHEKDKMITDFIHKKHWKVSTIKTFLVNQLEESVNCWMCLCNNAGVKLVIHHNPCDSS